MCGIVGFVSKRQESQWLILDSLKRLEYRGYDSAGIAMVDNGHLSIIKATGKLINLERKLILSPIAGNIGLGHTRWATHGPPTIENAHPHTDCHTRLVVVHNGIIENYASLKAALQKRQHKFYSQTDTEVIVHIIEEELDGGVDLLSGVCATLKQIQGAYAICVIDSKNSECIVAARLHSPLVIGLGSEGNFIASDITALLPLTREVIWLEDGDVAQIRVDSVKIVNVDKQVLKRKSMYVEWDLVSAERGGYKHFMLKEIYEQPQAVEFTTKGRVFSDGVVEFEELKFLEERLRKIRRICMVACGTAYHATMVAKYIFEELVKLPVEIDIGSEFRYRAHYTIGGEVLLLAVSQSGETADTLAALRIGDFGQLKIGICNVLGASLTRYVDCTLYTRAGPEIGVASTKAFTSQLALLVALAIYLAQLYESTQTERLKELAKELYNLPQKIQKVLDSSEKLQLWAKQFFKYQNFLFLGRGINYPIALEGALKLKEISYIHAEGYAGGEMKHGPIALIDENMPTVVVAYKGKVYEKILNNIEEIKARDGKVLAIATQGDEKIKNFVDDVYYLPQTDELLSGILSVVPLQLLAYYIALRRGCDIDQPRNLAKSVTVE